MKAHALSCGVIIVKKEKEDFLYLLLRAYNYWDFPKGIVEPGEDPLEAAKREVEEETGLKALQFDWGYDFRETGPYGRGKIARYYLARTDEERVYLPVNPYLGRAEHDEFRWMTFDEAIKFVAPRVKEALKWAHKTISSSPQKMHQ